LKEKLQEMPGFGDRLAAAVAAKQTPVVVGLDPRFASLPESVKGAKDAPLGARGAEAAAFTRFCTAIIDVVAPLVPAVKPQVAFFEELGVAGLESLAHIVKHARAKGLLVIVDAKRNDIGSTAEAYAAAYFGEQASWPADALTISPYLGDDSLSPFVNGAKPAAACSRSSKHRTPAANSFKIWFSMACRFIAT
jgi:orotidine-5'-phosphate decarboxylase